MSELAGFVAPSSAMYNLPSGPYPYDWAHEATCYICAPFDAEAEQEGCWACERSYLLSIGAMTISGLLEAREREQTTNPLGLPIIRVPRGVLNSIEYLR